MTGWLDKWLSREAPAISEAGPDDAAAIAALHQASFRRGWSEDEIEAMLLDHAVVADRAMLGGSLAGFILTRVAAEEAEVLSIAVDCSLRGRKLGRVLLNRNLQRLAALSVGCVFLEVDAANAPALRLYVGMGFEQVGHRPNYYRDAQGQPCAALILRRDLI